MANSGRLYYSDLKKFLIRRWLRTLPLYYFILLALLILYSILKVSRVQDEWKYFFFLSNFTFRPARFFGESWSLAIEEWFYVLFSSTLFIVTIISSNTAKAFSKIKASNFFGYLLIAFIVLIWFIKFLCFKGHQYNDIFTIVVFRLDAIAYGILAYWIFYTFKINESHLFLLFSLSFVLVFLAAIIRFVYSDSTIVGLSYYLVAGLGYAAFVLALRIYNWKITFRIISHISKVSYSIYITHLSLILFPLLKFYHPNTLVQKLFFFLIYTIVVYFASIFTYNVIERPFNKIRDRYF